MLAENLVAACFRPACVIVHLSNISTLSAIYVFIRLVFMAEGSEDLRAAAKGLAQGFHLRFGLPSRAELRTHVVKRPLTARYRLGNRHHGNGNHVMP